MREKPKFNKEKCYTCRFHGVGSLGYPITVKGRRVKVYCDYATIMEETCLYPLNGYKTKDVRGEDSENCKLYEPGRIARKHASLMFIGGQHEGKNS